MVNGAAMKYHHTLTMAILVILYSRMASQPQLLEDWEAFASHCPDMLADPRAVILQHYSSERLDDDSARKGFVEPDREPLPMSCLLH